MRVTGHSCAVGHIQRAAPTTTTTSMTKYISWCSVGGGWGAPFMYKNFCHSSQRDKPLEWVGQIENSLSARNQWRRIGDALGGHPSARHFVVHGAGDGKYKSPVPESATTKSRNVVPILLGTTPLSRSFYHPHGRHIVHRRASFMESSVRVGMGALSPRIEEICPNHFMYKNSFVQSKWSKMWSPGIFTWNFSSSSSYFFMRVGKFRNMFLVQPMKSFKTKIEKALMFHAVGRSNREQLNLLLKISIFTRTRTTEYARYRGWLDKGGRAAVSRSWWMMEFSRENRFSAHNLHVQLWAESLEENQCLAEWVQFACCCCTLINVLKREGMVWTPYGRVREGVVQSYREFPRVFPRNKM